jgi:hypothetical protein
VISSTGSVSQNAIVTDYDDPIACQKIAKEINGSTELEYNNIKVRVYSKATCDTRQQPVRGAVAPNPFIPFIYGMGNFIQQQHERLHQ